MFNKLRDTYKTTNENMLTTPSFFQGGVPFVLDGLKVVKIHHPNKDTTKQPKTTSEKTVTESYLELTKILSYESQEDMNKKDSNENEALISEEDSVSNYSFRLTEEDEDKKENYNKNKDGPNNYQQGVDHVASKFKKILERHIPTGISVTSHRSKIGKSSNNDAKIVFIIEIYYTSNFHLW